MELRVNMENFERRLDNEAGSVLFYKKGFRGIPDRTFQGEGYTIELKENEVVIFDIYNPELLIAKLAGDIFEVEAA